MKYQLMVDVKQDQKARVAPCCHFDKSLDINKFSEQVSEYDRLLQLGKRIPECIHCWSIEDRGLPSVRINSNAWLPEDTSPGIKRMDIRIHNKCNLACTMCYSGASNLWGKLEGKDTFYEISDDELKLIKEHAKNVEHISFQGGEPFYGTEYDDFLMSLTNLENITVDVFTNVISVKREVIERWKLKLKDLKINASVDGYGSVYESIRWPTKWEKFEKNAKMLHDVVGNKNLAYFWVMQAENISNLFDFLRWRDLNTPNSIVNLTLTMGSSELGIDYITDDEKSKFIKEYNVYINSVGERYTNGWYQKEYHQLKSMREAILKVTPNKTLISKRKDKINYILGLRERYRK